MSYIETTNFEKGIFTLSLDTEFAWGMLDNPKSLISNAEYFYKTREAIDNIIELLEKYDISATWAIVGSLLLEEPHFQDDIISKIAEGLEEDIRQQYINLLGDENIWSAKDVFKKIQSCSTPQEIASHSYSHIIFGDKNTTREEALKEFNYGKEILKKYGEDPISFIFPRNSINYLNELKESCFKVYRGLEPSWYKKTSGYLRKICHIADQTLAITPPVVIPNFNEDLINIPASMLYLSMNGFRKLIPLKSRVKKANKGIEEAIKEKKYFIYGFILSI